MLEEDEGFVEVTIESFTPIAPNKQSPFWVNLIHQRLQMFQKDYLWVNPDGELDYTIYSDDPMNRSDDPDCPSPPRGQEMSDPSEADSDTHESLEDVMTRMQELRKLRIPTTDEDRHLMLYGDEDEQEDWRLERDRSSDQKTEFDNPPYQILQKTMWNSDSEMKATFSEDEYVIKRCYLNLRAELAIKALEHALKTNEFPEDSSILLAQLIEDSSDRFLILTAKIALLSNPTKSVVVHLPADARYSNRVFRQLLVWGKHYILVPSQGPWLFYDENLEQVMNKPVVIDGSTEMEGVTDLLSTNLHIYFRYGKKSHSLGRLDRDFNFSQVVVPDCNRIRAFQLQKGESDLALIEALDSYHCIIRKGTTKVPLSHLDMIDASIIDFKLTHTGNYVLLESHFHRSPVSVTVFDGNSLQLKLEVELDLDKENKEAEVRLLVPYHGLFPFMVISAPSYFRGQELFLTFFCEFDNRVYRLGSKDFSNHEEKISAVFAGGLLWVYLMSDFTKPNYQVMDPRRFFDKWILRSRLQPSF